MTNSELFFILVTPFLSLFLILWATPQKNTVAYIPNHVDFESSTGEYDRGSKLALFNDERVVVPEEQKEEPSVVLGDQDGSNKRIEVDLTNQRLYAFEGGNKVFDFLVSTGKWGRTPTGTFRIWTKLRYTRMSGGNKAINTYYNLPNVPYTMFFANEDYKPELGYGIHGTYWHNNFGHPMSHGCINMKTEEVAQLYEWANPVSNGKHTTRATADNPGTPITIYGEAPKE